MHLQVDRRRTVSFVLPCTGVQSLEVNIIIPHSYWTPDPRWSRWKSIEYFEQALPWTQRETTLVWQSHGILCRKAQKSNICHTIHSNKKTDDTASYWPPTRVVYPNVMTPNYSKGANRNKFSRASGLSLCPQTMLYGGEAVSYMILLSNKLIEHEISLRLEVHR